QSRQPAARAARERRDEAEGADQRPALQVGRDRELREPPRHPRAGRHDLHGNAPEDDRGQARRRDGGRDRGDRGPSQQSRRRPMTALLVIGGVAALVLLAGYLVFVRPWSAMAREEEKMRRDRQSGT